MVIVDLLIAVLAVFGLGAATIHDLRTREVPDWITYGLIAGGFGIRLLAALGPEEWSYFFMAFVGLGVTYLLGSTMYYAKQWGGGDAKMMMALGVLFATRPSFLPAATAPFLGVLFVNILLFGAVYGLVWGVSLAWKHRQKFTKAAKQLLIEKKMMKMRMIAIVIAAIVFTTALVIPDIFLRMSIMTFALLILLYPYLWIYVKSVEKACLYKYVKPQQLTEGDWVDEDVKIKRGITIYKAKNTGIEKRDIQKLINARIKKVLVKEGIPFIPPFFLGTVATLLQLNIVTFL